MYPFRRLEVWTRAHAVAVSLLRDEELSTGEARYHLAGQVRRAAISVSANIAEGAGSSSHAQFARFLGIALASAHELEVLLEAAMDAELLSRTRCEAWRNEVAEVRAMLFALRRRVVGQRSRRGRTASP